MINSAIGVLAVQAPTDAKGDGITQDEVAKIRELFNIWSAHLTLNQEKSAYYNAGINVQNLQLAFKDDQVARVISPSVSWASKAVDMLAERSQLDFYAFPSDKSETQALIKALYSSNDLDNLYRQATISELIHGCACFTVTRGDSAYGEPQAVVNVYSALNSALKWNMRHKCIEYGMTITKTDADGAIAGINLFTANEVLSLIRDVNTWTATRYTHNMQRPLIEPIVYAPTIDNPLGKSRISRTVRSIINNALREDLRTEIAAEIFTVPQRFFLNVDTDSLQNDFRMYWNAFFAVNGSGDGAPAPTAGQFSPPGIQEHLSYKRALASEFAGETGIPLSSLGITTDNPASAEAIMAAREDLIRQAEYLNQCNRPHMLNVARLMYAVAANKTYTEACAELAGVFPYFKRTDMPSRAAIADMALKEVQSIPELSETRTFLRQLFPDDAELTVLLDELKATRESKATDNLINSIAQQGIAQQSESTTGEQ